MSNSLRPHELQHTRFPCPSLLSPKVYSNSCPLSQWCHPTISSSVIPFSSCPQSFPASGSFTMSQFFALGGQSIGASASASVLPMNIQSVFPLGLTGLVSFKSKEPLRVLYSTTIVVELVMHVWLFVTPWTAALQSSLSITSSWSPPKLVSIELVMPSKHLILCHPLLLLSSVFPSIRVFSKESVLCTRESKDWNFSISPSNEYSGLISFRIDWFDLLSVQGTQEFSPTPQLKSINSSALSFLYGPILTSIHDHRKNHSLD